MIAIKNLRYLEMRNAWDVRVDRKSVLGNPFLMRNESERESVCNEYAIYFDAIVKNNLKVLRDYGVSSKEREAFMNELRRLYVIHRKFGKLNLFCWCAPKRCHAETIKKFLEQYLSTPTKPDVHPSCKECTSEKPGCSGFCELDEESLREIADEHSEATTSDCSSNGEEIKTNLDMLVDLQDYLETTRFAMDEASRILQQYLDSFDGGVHFAPDKEMLSRDIKRLEKLASSARCWAMKVEELLPKEEVSDEEMLQMLRDSIDRDLQQDRDADMRELDLQPYSDNEEHITTVTGYELTPSDIETCKKLEKLWNLTREVRKEHTLIFKQLQERNPNINWEDVHFMTDKAVAQIFNISESEVEDILTGVPFDQPEFQAYLDKLAHSKDKRTNN